VSRPLSPAPPSVTPVRKRQASTRLHGRNLLLVRTVWITVAVLSVLCIAFGIPAEFARLQAPCAGDECQFIALTPTILRELEAMGLSAGFFAAYLVAVKLIFATVSFAVGTVIFWRKSDDRMALFAAFALVTLGGEAFAGVPGALLEGATPLRAVALLVSFLGNTSISYPMDASFPAGRECWQSSSSLFRWANTSLLTHPSRRREKATTMR
jgi:hypothetical protein